MILIGNKIDLEHERQVLFFARLFLREKNSERKNERENLPGFLRLFFTAGFFWLTFFPEVYRHEGEALAKAWGCPFMEISALSGRNLFESWYTKKSRRKILGKKMSHENPRKKFYRENYRIFFCDVFLRRIEIIKEAYLHQVYGENQDKGKNKEKCEIQ